MNRRAFLALVGAVTVGSRTAKPLTREVSPVIIPHPLVDHYLTGPNEWYVQKHALGFVVDQEIIDDDLYGLQVHEHG